ncbi:MAG TPA: dTDP-glucose 4,6-dehydratase [Acidimicrobiia bacterium]|nr:dTDP-glucose 4,6-dehydratase [Acidimicrobiia bacterium]
MVHLLVTGAAGFIGSDFVRHWVGAHPDDRVVALDLMTYAATRESLDEAADRIELVVGDIGDPALVGELLERHEIDVVVNFAAESHNSLAVLDPERFFRTNVIGTQRLLEAARRHGVDRFHHVSTDEVFGQLELDDPDAFTETTPYRPRTIYAASKAGADHVVRSYHETFGLPITISNCANNYGPFQFPEKVLPVFTTRALDDQPLPLYASTENRREWLHVRDHNRAIEAILDKGIVGETYMIGSGREASIMEIADLVLDTLGKPESLKQIVPDRPGHDRRYAVDATKIRRELGWAPTVEFDAGIRDTIRWYAANRAWWEPLRDRAPVVETAWATGTSAGE